MKYAEINKRFTGIIKDYLKDGYHINSSTMSGHQGEIAKIDLTDGKEIVRIIMESFYRRVQEYYLDGIRIIVGTSTDDALPDSESNFPTIWSNGLDVKFVEEFYQIGEERGRKRWYGSQREAIAQKDLHYKRLTIADFPRKTILPKDSKDVALRWLKKQKGCKSIKLSDIKEVYKWQEHDDYSPCYRIVAKGKLYRI